ncbi:hypothetical protein QTQ03_22800 [Micromonospora sp. WMMA1363]|uniref:hypothetical protein n=1 Tax=Micromonospora sp. WMMA1363 TaxID=3053985 RepID=UPI00259C9856|nr:hypothetical protein [Micromonospora sp. WMMA1363]MDM4722278.1 hypothetical protein [Micromonospora sp. WMMA1363]
MSSVASTHPLCDVVLRSLREMTRLAVAALALTAGLGGATAAAAVPLAAHTAQVLPAVDSDPRKLPPLIGAHGTTAAWLAATATSDTTAAQDVTPAWLTATATSDTESTAALPAWAAALPGVGPALAGAVTTAGRDAPADAPARGASTRRGPPSA